MKNSKVLIYCLPVLFLILINSTSSCTLVVPSDLTTQAEKFLKTLKEQDLHGMERIYPFIEQYEIFYASDTAQIISYLKQSSNQYRVLVDSYYLNVEGDVEYTPVELDFIYSTEYDNWYIVDSKNIASYMGLPYYDFAKKTGCIPEQRLSDVNMYYRMQAAKSILLAESKKLHNEFSSKVRIINTSIDRHGSELKVKSTLKNESEFSFLELKYKIAYYNTHNEIVKIQEGFIADDIVESGDLVEFSFIPSLQGVGLRAELKVDFDLEVILRYILYDREFSGEEYAEFIKQEYVFV